MKSGLIVIGGGPGGYVAAIRAAQLGLCTVLVERDALGGACLNRGCIPTKTLLHSASLYRQVLHSAAFGVTASDAGFDYAVMDERRRQVVEQLRRGVEGLLKDNGVKVIHGSAVIEGPGRVRVDEASMIADRQKKRIDPMYHEKIDHLLDTYAKKLAANMNQGYAIDARVPSIMIAGGSNFPVRKKEKQNAARDTNMQEWQYIQGLLDKIRSVGTGGIRQDDPQAISKLQKKLDGLEKLQETMKAVNAYYRKHKTLDGCPALTPEQVEKLKASMEGSWRAEPRPFESFQLTNNNAEIRRLRQRIESLTRANEVAYVGWEFDGGHVEASREQGRLQVFFEDKPDADARQQLKDNGFRWAPSAGAWQRLLNDNAYHAANRVPCIQPLTGEKPTDLQRHSSREQREQKAAKEEKPSIRAQLKAAKEEQAKKPPAREKSKELEV